MVPPLVICCVKEIERRGLHEVRCWLIIKITNYSWGELSHLLIWHTFICFPWQTSWKYIFKGYIFFRVSQLWPEPFTVMSNDINKGVWKWSCVTFLKIFNVLRLACTVSQALSALSRSLRSCSCKERLCHRLARWRTLTPSQASSRTFWGASRNLCSPSASTVPSWRQQVTQNFAKLSFSLQ